MEILSRKPAISLRDITTLAVTEYEIVKYKTWVQGVNPILGNVGSFRTVWGIFEKDSEVIFHGKRKTRKEALEFLDRMAFEAELYISRKA